ncbi:hypothetical protein F7734_44225 [Scytonema sp. UIC 10036]|uniref:hypothetical protein n=1 Tax=Scytonema sp. UIC 10036 TaxID=2304196 RepID=UPI0012DA58DC|nr:hypothetical protein [Scytonema sp. UIC 10036]MUG98934.1 hypothetical protein [Scytonema sp. UIC 10036]
MPAKTQQSITEQLQTQIEQVRGAIATKQEQLERQRERVSQFQEAVDIATTQPKWQPKPGELEPLDALKEMLSAAKTQQEKAETLTAARASLAFAKEAEAQLTQDKLALEERLRFLLNELDYQTRYADQETKYWHAFDHAPSPQEAREAQLASYQAMIEERQLAIKKAEYQIGLEQKKQVDPNAHVPMWQGLSTPQGTIENSRRAIAELQKNIEFWKRQPLGAPDTKNREQFRDFVRARASIELELTEFLSVQAQYLQSLERLRTALTENPCLGINPSELKDPVTRVELNNRNQIIVSGKTTPR